jgi:RNA polymerase sigma-70 factor (ECF subfamily)
MSEAPSTRASLLVRLRNPQDERAWAEFLAIYAPLVQTLARRSGLQPADSLDLEQEVFHAVAQAIDTYDPDPARGSFRGWLATIARNRLLNGLAARRRQATATGGTSIGQVLASVPDPSPGPDDSVLFETEYRRRVFHWAAERIRDQFQESTWLAFWRTSVEDRAVADVAAELGLTPGAIYVARSRVLSRLRQTVQDLEPDQS